MKSNSFIYQDQKLIAQLLKLAQQATPTGISSIPSPAVLDPNEDLASDPNQVRDIAKKLVDHLAMQQNTPAADFMTDKDNAELSTKHLKNLANLLNFLEDNGMEADGLKLVLKHMPAQGISSAVSGDAVYAGLSKEQQAQYLTYPKGANDFQYYVFKDGLIKYLQHLQTEAAQETPAGKVLRPYVSMLMEEANSQLGIDAKTTSQPNANNPALPAANKNQQEGQKPNAVPQQAGNQVIPAVWRPGQPLTQQQLQPLAAISNVYPFLPDRIDFRWIDEWLNSYFQVAQTFHGANLSLQNARMAKQYSDLILGWSIPQQALTATAAEIYTMAKSIAEERGLEPNAAMAFPWQYLQATQKLVLFLENTLLNFKSIFGPSLPADWREDLDKQVDNSASSLAAQTKAAISQWLNNLPAAQKQFEGGMR